MAARSLACSIVLSELHRGLFTGKVKNRKSTGQEGHSPVDLLRRRKTLTSNIRLPSNGGHRSTATDSPRPS